MICCSLYRTKISLLCKIIVPRGIYSKINVSYLSVKCLVNKRKLMAWYTATVTIPVAKLSSTGEVLIQKDHNPNEENNHHNFPKGCWDKKKIIKQHSLPVAMHLSKQQQSLNSSQVTPPAGTYPSSLVMKRLRVSPHPHGRGTSPSQGYP